MGRESDGGTRGDEGLPFNFLVLLRANLGIFTVFPSPAGLQNAFFCLPDVPFVYTARRSPPFIGHPEGLSLRRLLKKGGWGRRIRMLYCCNVADFADDWT